MAHAAATTVRQARRPAHTADAKRAPPPAHGQAGQRYRHHGDADARYTDQLNVVQLEARVGMTRKQPAVFDQQAWVVDCLADGDPALFPCSGNQEKGG